MLKDVRPLDPLGSGESYVDVARDGRLVYVPGHDPRTAPWDSPVWIDRRGQIERLPFADSLQSIALSPDDRRAAVARVASGETQIWIYDLQRGTRDQLTRDGSNFFPEPECRGRSRRIYIRDAGQLRRQMGPGRWLAITRGAAR